MAWDAIRAVDYLISRPEVDENKICMTGSSGGGMMTTYILPLDKRIAVAVPTCNPNTWSYRVHANLATDHEQIFFGAFESNIDPRGDLLFAHAPKPLLLNATTGDNLNPPGGVWDLSNWLYKLYSVHGAPEKFTTSMVKAAHDYNQEQREVTASWMLRWTGNQSGNLWEKEASLEKEEDLYATPGGCVFDLPDSKSGHDLIIDYLNKNKARHEEIITEIQTGELKQKMKSMIPAVLNTDFDNIQTNGHFKKYDQSDKTGLRKFVLEPEPGIVVPGVVLSPESASNGEFILYLNEKGKKEILRDADVAEQLLNHGYTICAVDLRGTGETSPDMAGKLWDFLAGKPIFGQRVNDVLSTVKWLKESELKAKKIKIWGSGMCALYGAFAGVLNDEISGFVLEEPLISFESVVRAGIPGYNHEVLLPGILKRFDMPQIYQSLAPRRVVVLNPFSGNKSYADDVEIMNQAKTVSSAYKVFNSTGLWRMIRTDEVSRKEAVLSALLK